MEEKEMYEFSWSGLFIVTACCSFLFSGIIKLLDGIFPIVLLVVGSIATILAIINVAARRIARQINMKRKSDQLAS